jgi:hypothetical protein
MFRTNFNGPPWNVYESSGIHSKTGLGMTFDDRTSSNHLESPCKIALVMTVDDVIYTHYFVRRHVLFTMDHKFLNGTRYKYKESSFGIDETVSNIVVGSL